MKYFLEDGSLETDEINKILDHRECYNILNERTTSTCCPNCYSKCCFWTTISGLIFDKMVNNLDIYGGPLRS